MADDAHPTHDNEHSGHGHPHGQSHGRSHGHSHGHDHTQAPGGRDWAAFGARLEHEGELVRPIHDVVIGEIRRSLADHPVRRVLDLGSGPGVATTLLAEAFPGSSATAVDASAPLLELAVARAERLGLTGRVRTAVADLEQPLDALAADGPADLVWASMVLHHVDRLAHTLREIHRLLVPGGVLALVEFGDDRSVLPSDAVAERPGFVDRHAAVVQEALAGHLPPGALSIDWPQALAAAGFEVDVHRREVLAAPAPLDDAHRRFVVQSLEVSTRLGLRRLDDLDLAVLARLLDERHPFGVMRRDDLSLRITRTIVVARRA